MKKVHWFSLLSGCFLVSSCVVPPSQPTAIIDMHNGLRKDIATNQVIAASPHQNSAMNSALLSSKTLQPISTEGVERRFDVSVNNAPAKSFFIGLVAGTPYNMVVSPDITGTVSLKLKNVTVEEALQAVEDIYGYSYQRTSYGFEVLPPSLQTQIFNVNYLDVDRNGHSDVNLSSTELSADVGTVTSGGTTTGSSTPSTGNQDNNLTSGAHVTTISKTNFWPSLQNTLTQMIGTGDGRSVEVNPQAGIVVVRGFPQDLREIAQYLDKTQLSLNRQVVLEAKILEVQLNDNYQAGIDWKALRASQYLGGTFDPSDGGNAFALNLGGDNTDFSAAINLLEQQGNVQVLSSPRISTVNNQQAVIKVGTDNFFVTSVTSNVVPSGNSATTSSSVGLTPFFSGITLDVTPEIGTTKDVVLHIHPSVSTVIDKTKVVDLGKSNGTDNKLTLPLAESTVRESDSVVHARDGQIIVIGGLMQNSTSENLNSTPGVSRIPFLGTLFRQTKQASAKSELVILLKPTVVNDNTWSQQLQNERNRFCDLDRGFHVGSRPEVFGTQGEIDY